MAKVKVRVSKQLFDTLKRAREWSGASIAEIARRAFRRYSRDNVALDEFGDNATTGGVVITVPIEADPDTIRRVLVYYLGLYDIPKAPDKFETPLRAGVDYVIERAEQ
jgi:hypothetical protein